jgi:hypothetical protein
MLAAGENQGSKHHAIEQKTEARESGRALALLPSAALASAGDAQPAPSLARQVGSQRPASRRTRTLILGPGSCSITRVYSVSPYR